MAQQIKYLKESEVTQVLADGFAELYNSHPKFPVTYLANYLKNYSRMKDESGKLEAKLSSNAQIVGQIQARHDRQMEESRERDQRLERLVQEEATFVSIIEGAEVHEEIMDRFCEWLEVKKRLTGVYIGEVQQPTKKIDLEVSDSEQAHIDIQTAKIVKFKAASNSHKVFVNKQLNMESVSGKLASDKPEGEGEAEQGGEGEEKPKKANGDIYINSVVENKDLQFFKYPKLGSYYGVLMKVNTYLSEKIFDSSFVKVETHRKATEQFQKEHQEREDKFKDLFDEKTNGGAEEKELEDMEKDFQKEQAAVPRPQLEEFETMVRDFIVGFDTLGQDRGIDQADRDYLRNFVGKLREAWQEREITLLKSDIDTQLKLVESTEGTQQEAFTKLLEQEDRQLPGNQVVQANKDNEKMMELELDNLRVQKVKEYMLDDKYAPYLDALLSSNVIKYPEIMKNFLFFLDLSKKAVCVRETNILEWRNAKKHILANKEKTFETLGNYSPRGAKITVIPAYAKWERISLNLEKYDQSTVASYNLFLAFILRFLQITAKVRKVDREVRIAFMKQERINREERIQERERKIEQKQEKLEVAKIEAAEKQEAFDQEAWVVIYDEENPLVEAGDQIVDEIDNDLEELPAEEPPAEVAQQ